MLISLWATINFKSMRVYVWLQQLYSWFFNSSDMRVLYTIEKDNATIFYWTRLQSVYLDTFCFWIRVYRAPIRLFPEFIQKRQVQSGTIRSNPCISYFNEGNTPPRAPARIFCALHDQNQIALSAIKWWSFPNSTCNGKGNANESLDPSSWSNYK